MTSASAIVANPTIFGPVAAGFLSLFHADVARPLVASSNYGANQIINMPFTVGLSSKGGLNIFSSSMTKLVVDVIGCYSTEEKDVNGTSLLFTPLEKPVRLIETRAGSAKRTI